MARRLVPSTHVTFEEIGDEFCLLRLDTADVLVLNRTASDIWLLVTDGMDAHHISDALSMSYGVPLDDVAPQVEAALAQFEERGFVVPR